MLSSKVGSLGVLCCTMPTVSLAAVVSTGLSIPAVLDKSVGNPYYGE